MRGFREILLSVRTTSPLPLNLHLANAIRTIIYEKTGYSCISLTPRYLCRVVPYGPPICPNWYQSGSLDLSPRLQLTYVNARIRTFRYVCKANKLSIVLRHIRSIS